MAERTKRPERHTGADWAQQAWLWPLEATRLALDSYAQWFTDPKPAPSPEPEQTPLAWTTPNSVVLQLPSMRLREFSHGGSGQQPVVVCAPYALHAVFDVSATDPEVDYSARRPDPADDLPARQAVGGVVQALLPRRPGVRDQADLALKL